jgi:AmmeMemoRadiSam system protein A
MATSGVVLGVLSPHPPIVVPEIGERNIDRVRATRDGLQEMAGLVADLRPDTVVIISPHGPVLRDAMTLMGSGILEGNFREFGIAGTALRYGNDMRLVNKTIEEAAKREVNAFAADAERTASSRLGGSLHYSILVPLYYLKRAGVESRLVAGAAGPISAEGLFAFGQSLALAAEDLGIRVVYIASGDLSHRLTEGAPAGYDPMGKVFDQKVVEALNRADLGSLMNLPSSLVERAGECGLGPIITLAGALDGKRVLPQVLSYEGPFGVGYCVATLTPTGPAPARVLHRGGEVAVADGPAAPTIEPVTAARAPLATAAGTISDEAPDASEAATAAAPTIEPVTAARAPLATAPGTISDEAPTAAGTISDEAPVVDAPDILDDSVDARRRHPFVRLARLALETHVRSGRKINPPAGVPGLDRRAGVFVSLRKEGELRGCIGTLEAAAPNLAEEIIRNAIQSGTADPRFYPVEVSELSELVYSVDVLEPAVPVASLADLNPNVYGVIVSKGNRTGLLLPDLAGVDTVEDQVSIAMQKAGIQPGETGVSLFRFKVTRYK